MTSAKVVADSISPSGHRLTTMELVFPRIILAEFNTHRVFSRNSASSRAIPVDRMLELVELNPYIPKVWTRNQPGMQGGERLTGSDAVAAECVWHEALWYALKTARKLRDLDVHKQHINRLLEPFMWHQVVVSSTEWDNFFRLRGAPDAQPEMQDLCWAMVFALADSCPVQFQEGDGRWHLPYVTTDENVMLALETRKKVSVARCARVSYMRQNDVRAVVDDVRLYDRLLASGHMSPFEHVARPMTEGDGDYPPGNFTGWMQLRHVS